MTPKPPCCESSSPGAGRHTHAHTQLLPSAQAPDRRQVCVQLEGTGGGGLGVGPRSGLPVAQVLPRTPPPSWPPHPWQRL